MRRLARDRALAQAHADRRQLGPRVAVADPVHDFHDHAGALLDPAVALLLLRELAYPSGRQLPVQGLGDHGPDVLQQLRLVLLHRQHVVAAAGHDLGGDLLLAAHGVDGHQGPLQVEQLQ